MGTTAAAEYVEAVTGDTTTPEAPIPVLVVAPVRVEDQAPRSLVTDQIPVADVAVRIASALPTRARLTIATTGADVYVGGASVTPGTGYKLTSARPLDLTTTAAVYAVAVTGAPAVVHVLAEVREG